MKLGNSASLSNKINSEILIVSLCTLDFTLLHVTAAAQQWFYSKCLPEIHKVWMQDAVF